MIPPGRVLREQQVIVCAGSGGVGKTTTATAIALAAARDGRRVLALTVDPSRRLAQTLGVSRNLVTPAPLPADRAAAAGISDPSLLEAWMLDPGIVADQFVHRFAESPDEAQRLTQNRIYRQVSRMIAGMQEYTAMEALHNFMREGRYDLIVLDTPPSRHALDFLYGPKRLAAFLDGRIFSLFLPSENQGLFRRTAGRVVNRVNSAVFGEETYNDLQEFFSAFSRIFMRMNKNASQGFESLKDPKKVAFLLVTSPATEALTDAFFFRRKCVELDLPFRGFVLNRSLAAGDDRAEPPTDLFGPAPTAAQAAALAKLLALAELERAAVGRHRSLLAELEREAGGDAFTVPLPLIPTGAEDMGSLVQLGEVLVRHGA